MKKNKVLVLLLGLLFAISSPLYAQTVLFTAQIPGSSSILNLRNTGVYNHRLTWTGKGTRTSCTVKVSKSADAVTWTDLIADQTCTTDGATTTTGYTNYVKITVGTLTGTGNTVYARYDGAVVQPSAGTVTVDNAAQETGGNLAAIKAKTDNIPALGQALAAASVPVILPAATITTLTPPAAITGFALEGGGNLATLAGAVSSSKVATKAASGDFADGAIATIGAKADAKSSATDTTAITLMQVLKQISYQLQNLTVAPVTADGADGAAPTNPPVPVTGRARATEVAAVDAGDSLTDTESLVGGKLVHVGALPQDHWQLSSAGTAIADTTFVAVIAHTDDYFTVVQNLLVTNSDATVGTVVKVVMGTGTLCGTGTAILFEGYAASLGGGFAIANPEGLFSTTAHSNDICIAAVTTSAEINWSMSGFKTKLDRVSN